MKLLRYETEGQKKIGILSNEGSIIAVEDVLKSHSITTMQQAIEVLSKDDILVLKEASARPQEFMTKKREQVKLLAPVERPLHDILCVGVNYKAHLEEATGKAAIKEAPKQTVYFSKRAIRILGTEEEIQAKLTLDEELDYEVELAVIIGKTGTNIKAEEAEDYIFGYSVFNDISSRRLQKAHMQWFRGKSLDTYTAMGPVILHKSALPFPVETDVICRVNGEERQHSNTTMLLKAVPDLIAELSQGMTLEAGDIIATGTPAGVAMGMQPPRYLKPGDIIECEIPGIGILRNKVEEQKNI